jgi:hypothetical protein
MIIPFKEMGHPARDPGEKTVSWGQLESEEVIEPAGGIAHEEGR